MEMRRRLIQITFFSCFLLSGWEYSASSKFDVGIKFANKLWYRILTRWGHFGVWLYSSHCFWVGHIQVPLFLLCHRSARAHTLTNEFHSTVKQKNSTYKVVVLVKKKRTKKQRIEKRICKDAKEKLPRNDRM